MTPRFCPLCGAPVEAVRHVAAHIFEMLCERCGMPNVIMVNDFQKVEAAATNGPDLHDEKSKKRG